MITTTVSSQTRHVYAFDIEAARALFAAGDYGDVLKVVTPVLARPNVDAESRFAALLLKACVEFSLQQHEESLATLKVAGLLLDQMPPELKGKFYGQRAVAHRNLDEIDDALIDYEEARFWARKIKDEQTEASVRNNLAKIYSDLDRFDEAIIEVDAAIKIATRSQDEISLGRYYDNKAHILIDHQHFPEALTYSKKAIALLASHPSGEEARSTHGLAMVCLGATYLDEKPKSISSYRARHNAAKIIHKGLDAAMIEQALRRSKGHVLKAAKVLCISHPVLIRLIERHRLERVPKRRRAKALITK